MSLTVNWKLAVGVGSAAFLLSAVSGVVGGVGFGAIFVRALLAGLLFAAFGIGLETVVRRFLPELIGNDASDELGSRVNIVVDDEDEQLPQSQSSGATPGSNVDGANESVRSDADSAAEDNWDDLENPEESLVQEVQEVRGAEEAEDASEPGESAETGQSSEPEKSPTAEQPVAAGELDELPDVGRFAEDFSSVETGTQSSGTSNRGATESNGQDPEMIARALTTMLKRESE